ncbi:unnamed protein product [Moneuplotes crassus]|uniref:SWI/SNF-related matrix-associated actin-dependent regulator of chromatin subfamily A-like protein 1 n=1 Tax=Euplotes crassus TaxID=5936 RepID=A0AAD1Y0M7_EUPCR|nr:unnamed protein product [Moneuplotes crassus]
MDSKYQASNVDNMDSEQANRFRSRGFNNRQKSLDDMFGFKKTRKPSPPKTAEASRKKKIQFSQPKATYRWNKNAVKKKSAEASSQKKEEEVQECVYGSKSQKTLTMYPTGEIADSENIEKRIVFELVSDHDCAVKFYNYFTEQAKEIIKKVKRSRFDNDEHCWVFPKEQYMYLKDELRSIVGSDVKISLIPEFISRLIKFPTPYPNITRESYNYSIDKVNKYSLDNLPESLLKKLLNFQKHGVEYCIRKCGRAIIGDEMGVGKTIQAIATAYVYKEDWPVLVICPSSLKHIWKYEILKWLSSEIKEEEIQVFETGKDDFDKSRKIFIFSYELATRMSEKIDKMEFKVVIIDEAHYLKSRDAKRCRMLLPIITEAKRILFLTGTPILSRPIELFNLVKALRPDMIRQFLDYAYRYCNPRENKFGTDFTGASCMKELHYILEKSFMIRRLKKEVLSELPDKRRQLVDITVDKKMQDKIKNVLTEQLRDLQMRSEDPQKFLEEKFDQYNEGDKEADFEDTVNDLGHYFTQAYQLTGEAKTKGILDFVTTMIESDTKFLIFAHHISVMDAIETFLYKRKVKSIRIDGKTKQNLRHKLVEKFQNDEKIKVAILSITACSHGLTLTASCTVVFAELFWTPGVMIQAEDRVHRIGQANSVSIYYLFGEDTLDQIMLDMILSKSEIIASTLDGVKNSEFCIGTNKNKRNFSMMKHLAKFCNLEEDFSNSPESSRFDSIQCESKVNDDEFQEILESSKNKTRKKTDIYEEFSIAFETPDPSTQKKRVRKQMEKEEPNGLTERDYLNFMVSNQAKVLQEASQNISSSRKFNKIAKEIKKKQKSKKKSEFIQDDDSEADEMFDLYLDQIREANRAKIEGVPSVPKKRKKHTSEIERVGFLNDAKDRENQLNMTSFEKKKRGRKSRKKKESLPEEEEFVDV